MSYVEWFLRALVLVPVTLLPIINPLSTAPVFVATVGSNRAIARRLARLANAPFIKVEATKFTEVGYVGRDVEQIVRDLAGAVR